MSVLAVIGFKPDSVAYPVAAADTASTYKAQCVMCHSPKAEKFFDPAKKDEEHIETILKGKKGEKPPYMPAFEAKGMKAEEAKALAEYMKTLRTPQN
ncbi:MAG: cytochrome c [Acidobacteria bacterium]|nr:cytochrome c [Acidobacteriota bacterium]